MRVVAGRRLAVLESAHTSPVGTLTPGGPGARPPPGGAAPPHGAAGHAKPRLKCLPSRTSCPLPPWPPSRHPRRLPAPLDLHLRHCSGGLPSSSPVEPSPSVCLAAAALVFVCSCASVRLWPLFLVWSCAAPRRCSPSCLVSTTPVAFWPLLLSTLSALAPFALNLSFP